MKKTEKIYIKSLRVIFLIFFVNFFMCLFLRRFAFAFSSFFGLWFSKYRARFCSIYFSSASIAGFTFASKSFNAFSKFLNFWIIKSQKKAEKCLSGSRCLLSIRTWPRQPVHKKQADGQASYSWALNLDRFLKTGFFQGHFLDRRQNRVKK